MAIKNSYFKIYRSIYEDQMWNEKPFDNLHAWIWLIAHANFKDTQVIMKGKTVTIKRGQILTSEESLAATFGWSRGKVRRYSQMLQKDGKIQKNSTAGGTVLTIENYEKYQSTQPAGGTTDGTTDGTTGGTHHNKLNNKYNPPETRARAREGGDESYKPVFGGMKAWKERPDND